MSAVCSTAAISSSVFPRAPASTMPSAVATLTGETTRFSSCSRRRVAHHLVCRGIDDAAEEEDQPGGVLTDEKQERVVGAETRRSRRHLLFGLSFRSCYCHCGCLGSF